MAMQGSTLSRRRRARSRWAEDISPGPSSTGLTLAARTSSHRAPYFISHALPRTRPETNHVALRSGAAVSLRESGAEPGAIWMFASVTLPLEMAETKVLTHDLQPRDLLRVARRRKKAQLGPERR
ncbi:hypothetical protein K3495_g1825 [Podosphaera aphanis]|nr:hypothetical protein K3495_g1825 [Podosphaera aphanis]